MDPEKQQDTKGAKGEMRKTFYIVDAMAFAFRAFYAIKRLSDPQGRPTNAIYGLTRILLKLLREQQPDYIAVVFDAPGPTFRKELYADYKANRDATPEDLLEQFPRMHEVVCALGLPLFSVEGVEADDVIGTLAERAAAEGLDVVLVSGDKDLMQLIGDHIRMFDPGKNDHGQWFGVEDVVERFGAPPERVPDALGLIGDTADNIPGVRGIGEKTAKDLMQQFGSLENLYARIDEVKGKKREYLETDRDLAFLSRDLATIRRDVVLPADPLACQPSNPDPRKLKVMLDQLGFRSLFPLVGAEAEELVLRILRDDARVAGAVELDALAGLPGGGYGAGGGIQRRGAGRVAVLQEGGDRVVDHLHQHVAGLVVGIHAAVDEGHALAHAAGELELEVGQAVVAHAAAKAHHGGLAHVGALGQLAHRQRGEGARVGQHKAGHALLGGCQRGQGGGDAVEHQNSSIQECPSRATRALAALGPQLPAA